MRAYDCCKRTRVETRRRLVQEAQAWARSGQSIERLIYRLRSVPVHGSRELDSEGER